MDVVDTPPLTASLVQARHVPVPPGALSAPVLSHASLELHMYQPGDVDGQAPHDRNELYVVVAGSAVLLRGGPQWPWQEPPLIEDPLERIPMRAGDAAIVPAGTTHRFVEISDDFAAWSAFWGPEGGEPA